MSIRDLIRQANSAIDEVEEELREKAAKAYADRRRRSSGAYCDEIQPKVEEAVECQLTKAIKFRQRDFTLTPKSCHTVDDTEIQAWKTVLHRLGFPHVCESTRETVDICDYRCDESILTVQIPRT